MTTTWERTALPSRCCSLRWLDRFVACNVRSRRSVFAYRLRPSSCVTNAQVLFPVARARYGRRSPFTSVGDAGEDRNAVRNPTKKKIWDDMKNKTKNETHVAVRGQVAAVALVARTQNKSIESSSPPKSTSRGNHQNVSNDQLSDERESVVPAMAW